ncbi:MAG: PepSY domain-containing protein [Pontixanthobacter sp.]
MKRIFSPALAATLLATGLAGTPISAQNQFDQGEARKEMQAGNLISLRDIERRVADPLKAQGYEYLGPIYDSVAMAYRLKFIKDGRVTFVDVDARTGKVLRRSR